MRWAEAAILVAIVFHIAASPFTKVEESFNMQATHDLLYHGLNISAYDHHTFPGVVPRTFSGAVVVAAASSPFVAAANAFFSNEDSKLAAQYVVRAALGVLSWASIVRLASAVRALHALPVRTSLGPRTAAYFALLTAAQFHVPFYASRFLPNTFALILCNLASAEWIHGKHPLRVVYLMAFTVVVVRCDAALLAGPMGILMLLSRQLSLPSAVLHGAVAVAISLALTVPLDSLLWQRLLWPEGEVLYFNTILGKSVEWGTSPPHWYFTSALPRALLAALPFSALGLLWERRVRPQLAAAWAFVVLYSFLAHKEVRFLFPVLLLFNVGAAAFVSRAHLNRRKNAAWGLVFAGCVAGIAACLAVTCVMSYAAYWNYPGGYALQRLHSLHDSRVRQAGCGAGGAREVRVHIGVLPAMTGVTRFGEKRTGGWVYDKTEGLSKQDFRQRGYDYLLAGEQGTPGFVLAGVEEGFSRLALYRRFPFLGVATEPRVYLLARSDGQKRSPCVATTKS